MVQCGWGFLLLRQRQQDTRLLWINSFWIGLLAIFVFLQLWHLILPVTPVAMLVVGSVGLIGLAREIRARRPWRPSLGFGGLWVGVVFLFGVLIANYALRAPIFYDNGLYHLQAIQWVREYPIVPGLGNLHGRLAFNTVYFLYAALWDSPLWEVRGSQIVNGALTLAVVGEGIVALASAFRTRHLSPSALLPILLLYPLINLLFDPLANYLSGPTTDYIVWLFSLKLGVSAFRFLEDSTPKAINVFEVLAVGILLVLTKLSGAMFAVAIAGMVLVVAWRRGTVAVRHLVTIAFLIAGIALIPWVSRTIILSGYPVYPTTFGALSVEWRVSPAQALDDTNYVQSWARYPVAGSHWSEVLGNWEWLISWQANFWRTRGIRLSVLVASIAWGMVALIALVRRQVPPTVMITLLWLLPSLVSLIFWFFSAPDPRFALAYFWLVVAGGAVALWASLPQLNMLGKQLLQRIPLERLTALVVLAFIIFSHGFQWQQELAPIPSVQINRYQTLSGLQLYVPVEGEQCWDAPLPCTPYPKPELRLRERQSIGSGFTGLP